MDLERITSAANPRIKRLTALQQKHRERERERAYAAEGVRLFSDTPQELIEEVFLTEKLLSEDPGIAAKLQGCRAFLIPESLLEKVSDTRSPQGVIFTVKMREYAEKDLLGGWNPDADLSAGAAGANSASGKASVAPLLLVLEDIRDPGNLGTMFRSAEAAGVTGILMSAGTADIYQPKAVRSTMSAVYRVPHRYTDDLCGDIERMKDMGITVFAADLKAAKAYDTYNYVKPSAILIGNEAHGLNPEAAAAAGRSIIIPMCGGIESLNAAVAASVLMFEAARQRRK